MTNYKKQNKTPKKVNMKQRTFTQISHGKINSDGVRESARCSEDGGFDINGIANTSSPSSKEGRKMSTEYRIQ